MKTKRPPLVRLSTISTIICLMVSFSLAGESSRGDIKSQGLYRLPYDDETYVEVFDDFTSHRPTGRIDLFAVKGQKPFRVVAAADGIIMAIQDDYSEQQSGRKAADCHNNYVWIAHANGEWTNYCHLARGSVTKGAKLKV